MLTKPLIDLIDNTKRTNDCVKLKSVPTIKLIDVRCYKYIAVDAEWSWLLAREENRTGKKANFISVQLAFSKEDGKVELVVVFWNNKYKSPSDEEIKCLEVIHDIKIIIILTDSIDKENLLNYFILPKKLKVLMYYSPKDMQGLLGASRWREMLIETVSDKKTINKMRRLNVADFEIKDENNNSTVSTTDLIGMFNSSLDDALKSVGISNPYKDLATINGRDKGHMEWFIAESPLEFLQYSIGDVLYLHQAMILRTKQINEIVEKALGIQNLYTIDNVKLSSGSLVADVFEKWLIAKYPDLYRAVMMLTVSNNSKEWGNVLEIRNKLKAETGTEVIAKCNSLIKNMAASVHGLASGSIRAYYPGNYGTGTVTYGAVVQGGRCVNERPLTNFIEYVLDIDLSSCYGSALRNFDYPFGLPTLYGKDIDDNKITLGEFLAKNGNDLVNGLYQIYVSGSLSFHQDLVHSKYGLNTRKIASQLFSSDRGEFDQSSDFSWDREIETAHIEGDFLLTTKQIEFGIITADNLEVIRKVSSDKELKGWMDLTVDCAVYYPKSKELSVEDFTRLIMDERSRGYKRCKSDTRSTNWCRISLENFIGKFIEIRKEYKNLMKKEVDGSEIKKELDLKQNSCKLFINTAYGCLAAPYFPMGNTILANNITAKARTGVWMMAKALNTIQSITDGGIYSPLEVHYLKVDNKKFYKPGFNYLYLRNGVNWKDSVGTCELFPKTIIKEIRDAIDNEDNDAIGKLQKEIDTKATSYINEFWQVYDLKLAFNIEHKIANTGYSAGYCGSADYAINTGKEVITKTRGAKPESHPKKLYLKSLVRRSPIREVPHTFMDSKSLGVSQFQECPGDVFLPGDDIDVPVSLKPRKHSGILYATQKDWKKDDDAHNKAVTRYYKDNDGIPLENWSRFPTIR